MGLQAYDSTGESGDRVPVTASSSPIGVGRQQARRWTPHRLGCPRTFIPFHRRASVDPVVSAVAIPGREAAERREEL